MQTAYVIYTSRNVSTIEVTGDEQPSYVVSTLLSAKKLGDIRDIRMAYLQCVWSSASGAQISTELSSRRNHIWIASGTVVPHHSSLLADVERSL